MQSSMTEIILNLPEKPTSGDVLRALVQAEQLGYERACREFKVDEHHIVLETPEEPISISARMVKHQAQCVDMVSRLFEGKR